MPTTKYLIELNDKEREKLQEIISKDDPEGEYSPGIRQERE